MVKNTERREKAVKAVRKAALELFVEKGYTETSLKDIAVKAGYTPGNIYHYYPSKRSIALELAEHLSGELAGQEYLVFGQYDRTRDKILHLIRGFLDWSVANPHAAMFLYGFFDLRKLTDDNTLPHLSSVPRYVAERVIREGQERGEVRQGDPTRLYVAFTGVVELLRMHLGGRLTKAEYLGYANDLADLIWRAIRADGTPEDG